MMREPSPPAAAEWRRWPPPSPRGGCSLLVVEPSDGMMPDLYRAANGVWRDTSGWSTVDNYDADDEVDVHALWWRVVDDPVGRPEPDAWVLSDGHCPSCGEERLKTGSESWCEQNDCHTSEAGTPAGTEPPQAA